MKYHRNNHTKIPVEMEIKFYGKEKGKKANQGWFAFTYFLISSLILLPSTYEGVSRSSRS